MNTGCLESHLRLQFLITVVDRLLKPQKVINRKEWKEKREVKKGRNKERGRRFHLIESSWLLFRKNLSFYDSELVWLFFISLFMTRWSGFHPLLDWLIMSWTNVNCFHQYFLTMQWSSHLLPRAHCLFLKLI